MYQFSSKFYYWVLRGQQAGWSRHGTIKGNGDVAFHLELNMTSWGICCRDDSGCILRAPDFSELPSIIRESKYILSLNPNYYVELVNALPMVATWYMQAWEFFFYQISMCIYNCIINEMILLLSKLRTKGST